MVDQVSDSPVQENNTQSIPSENVAFVLENPDMGTIRNSADINTRKFYDEKTLAIALKTGEDVDNRQVVYEQGGNLRGINMFIEDGKLMMGTWNFKEQNWGYKQLEANIEANTAYTATFVFDGNANETGTIRALLNGQSIGEIDGVGLLYRHSGRVGIGRVQGQTVLNEEVVSREKLTFEGTLFKVAQFNEALAEESLEDLEEFLRRDVEAFTVTPIEDDAADTPIIEETPLEDQFPDNLSPIARDDQLTVNEDKSVRFFPLSNDSDPEGDALKITAVSSADHGSISLGRNVISYTPDSEYNGTDKFTYTITDGKGATSTATVSLNVIAVNDAPTIVAAFFDVGEDVAQGTMIGQVSAADIDGDALSFSILSGNDDGMFTIDNAGVIRVAKALDFETTRNYDLQIQVSDTTTSTTTDVNIQVGNVNEAASAVGDVANINEDNSVTLDLLANDSDLDGDALTIKAMSGAAFGAVVLNNDGTVTYTPETDFNGVDRFTYTISDGHGSESTAVVRLNVAAVNDAPTVVSAVFEVAENSEFRTVVGQVAATDLDGEALSYDIISGNDRGLFNIDENGVIRVVGQLLDFETQDAYSLEVQVSDGTLNATANIDIKISDVNEAVTATDDNAGLNEDGSIVLDLLANDSDADGDRLSITALSAARFGAVVLNNDGTVTYTPEANYNGADSFTYTVSDGRGETSSASVSLNVNAVDDAPTIVSALFNVAEDAQIESIVGQVVASDVDGDSLTFAITSGNDENLFFIDNNGVIRVAGALDFENVNSYPLEVAVTSASKSAVTTITVNVTNVNEAVTASNDTAALDEDAAITLNVLANDSDADGDALTITSVAAAAHGLAVLNDDGTITYTPNANYNGADSFTYTINDGNGESSTATVSLNVTAVNDAPTVISALFSVAEDAADGTVIGQVSASDLDGDALSFSITSGNDDNLFSIDTNGMIRIADKTNLDFETTNAYALGIQVSDGITGNTTNVTVNVTNVNEAPTAAADGGFMVDAGAMVMIQLSELLGNDSDLDGDSLSITSVQNATNGTVMIMNGMVHFTGGAEGAGSFEYTLSDGNGATDTGSVSVMVHAAPVDDNNDDGMHGGHGDHGHGDGDYGNVTLAEAIASQQMLMDHGAHAHGDHAALAGEHGMLLELFPLADADATAVALNSGSWFDADTWSTGEVPTDGMDVYIPQGVAVMYDGVSETSINVIGVDGKLHFDTTADSKLVVDTLLTGNTSVLEIGTQDNPVPADVNIDIVIANNGDIDVSWDPTLISRGVVTHGTVDIHGAEKTTHLKVANDPMAGDNSITLSEDPQGWQVGDTIVLAGTNYDGYKWDNDVRASIHHDSEDETLTISKIEGNVIHFDTALLHDHVTPRADLKTSVANYTRNVSIESEDGAASETHHRGHVMFMHNDDVDVRYAEFSELGRTDKSFDARNPVEFDPLESDSNVKGRYSMHFHRTGVDDVENPAIAEGNAVFGSPGWGFVHHDSNAVMHDNATFNTFGAGFVAETGNEIGTWSNNIAIFAQGRGWGSPKNINDPGNFDNGLSGSGFYFEGRMVEVFDNIASSVNSGFTYFHRGRADGYGVVTYDEDGNKIVTPTRAYLIQDDDEVVKLDGVLAFDSELFDLPEALGNVGDVRVDDAPILHFGGNETFASHTGFFVEKANPNQGHDLRSVIKDFTAWEVLNGAHLAYTSHYTLENFDVTAKEAIQFQRPGIGIDIGTNASDISIINAKVDGFPIGIVLSESFTGSSKDQLEFKQHVVVNAQITNAETKDYSSKYDREAREWLDLNTDVGQILTTDDLVEGRFEINFNQDLVYRDRAEDGSTSRRVVFDGTKTDSIGDIDLPAGIDSYDLTFHEAIKQFEVDGYYTAADGKIYTILEEYYSDRATGEIHKFGHLVEVHEETVGQIGNPYFVFKNALDKGEIDLDSVAPDAQDDSAMTQMETDVIIDLLANDSDPDGDILKVDGIVQPDGGRVYDNGDGTVTYRPDLEFTGVDTFKYWTTDGMGNFTPAYVTVHVHEHGSDVDITNAIPVTEDDIVSAQENTPIVISPLTNDTDADGDTLSLLSVGDAQNGTVTMHADGTVTYVADPGFYGKDQFTYTTSDGTANAGGEVVLNVTGTGGGAGLLGKLYMGAHATLEAALADAQSRESDADFVSTKVQYAEHHNDLIDLLGDDRDSLTQTPEASHNDGFLMNLSGKIYLEAGTHTFRTTGEVANSFHSGEPIYQVLVNGEEMADLDGMIGSTLLQNRIEIEGAGYYDIEINYLNESISSHIEVRHSFAGSPFEHLDSSQLIYRGEGNIDPQATDDTGFMVDSGEMVMIQMSELLGNDSDLDGDTLSITSVQNATGGTAMIMNGMIHFTGDAEGMGGFEYTLSDGNGGTDTGSVSVMVHAAADHNDDGMHGGSGDDGMDDGSDDHSGHDHGDDTTDDTGGHDHGDHGGHDHGHGDSTYGSVTLAEAIASQQMLMDHGAHAHGDHAALAGEHGKLLELFPLADADTTAVALNSGSWFDADTWSTGEVPTDGMDVYIPQGVAVMYDGVSETSINVIGVDGKLHFDTTADSKLVVDTLLTGNTSVLEIGTQENPVPADVNIDIVIANNGDIDVSWDPTLISRGVVTHGTVDIHGAEKTTHLKVANDPMAGDNSITLSEDPQGWQVGDTIVIAGTRYEGWQWDGLERATVYKGSEDEVVTITSIDGSTVHFDTALTYDHATPRDDLKTSVANYTRNISIESEDGAASETHHRGHVMFMHNDDVDVRYVEFTELGRTDKSELALNSVEFDSIQSDSNVKGRYSMHFHRTGVDDVESPAIAEGNAVFGSPGWGFVHHDSNAILHDNATFGTLGAGFVAETGNEIGSWSSNIAINAEGRVAPPTKSSSDGVNFDTAFGGAGFYFQGRMVENFDNIAASTNQGFIFWHRGRADGYGVVTHDEDGNRIVTPTNNWLIKEGDEVVKLDGNISFDPELFDLPDALGAGNAGVNQVPILHFQGNEAFATRIGFGVTKGNPAQGHDVHSHFKDFTAWNVGSGIEVEYTAHYTFEDIDIIGQEGYRSTGGGYAGISVGNRTHDISVVNATIDNFEYGAQYVIDLQTVTQSRGYNLIDVEFKNITGEEVKNGASNQDAIDKSLTIANLADLLGYEFGVALDSPLKYDPIQGDTSSRRVFIDGTKTDTLGEIDLVTNVIGNHLERFDADMHEFIDIMQNDGYFSSPDGKNYFVLPDYYTDRANGEIHKFGYLVEIGENQNLSNAIYKGEIDFDNAAPIAQNDSAVTELETDVIIDLLANDSDADGDALKVDGILQPHGGRVFDNGDGTVTYRPDLEFAGIDSFKYWTSDGMGNFTPAVVTVEVKDSMAHDDGMHGDHGNDDAVNHAPMAMNDDISINEDSAIIINPLGNDHDADGDALTITSVAAAAHGLAVLNDDGTITYTPNANYNGADSFTYTVSDGNGATDTANVSLNVTAIDDAPTIVSALFSVAEDASNNKVVGQISATDVDGDTLSFSILSGNDDGIFSIDDNGMIRISDNTNLDFETTNAYALQIEVSDGTTNVTTDVDINITNVSETSTDVDDPDNTAPVIGNDAKSVAEDTSLVIDLLANDSDPDGDTLTITDWDEPEHGTVVLNDDQTITYTPDPDYNGTELLFFTISDGNGGESRSFLSIRTYAVNDMPTVAAAMFEIDEDAQNGDVVGQIVASDVDGDTLEYTISDNPGGIFDIDEATGQITIIDNTNLDFETINSYALEIAVSDPTTTVNITADITVKDVSEVVEAGDDTGTLNEDSAIILDLLANDTNGTNGALSIATIGAAEYGTLINNGDGTVTYTPDADYNGPDRFTYIASNDSGETGIATVFLNVTVVNDAPTIVSALFNVSEDASNGTVVGHVGASDIDGDTLSYAISSGNDDGVFEIDNATGQIRIADNTNLDFETMDAFALQIEVSDGEFTANANIEVSVADVNEAAISADAAVQALLAQTDRAEGLDDPSLALGIAGIADWITQMPFIDIMKMSRPLFTNTKEGGEHVPYEELVERGILDENGWPTELPEDLNAIGTVWAWNRQEVSEEIRKGIYEITYEGEGNLDFAFVNVISEEPGKVIIENPDGGLFGMNISETDPNGTGDYIRNIQVVHEDNLDYHEAGMVFNPQWLDIIEDAREIRFMDWIETNHSHVETWDEMRGLDDVSWYQMAPIEAAVQLANEVGADAWFTMPHNADDQYIRNFATYVRDNLDPNLKVTVEFSNEVWNTGFAQTKDMMVQSLEDWGVVDHIAYHVKQATNMALIWDDVFGDQADDRLVKALGGQARNTVNTKGLLDPKNWFKYEPEDAIKPEEVFDAFAVTTYFGEQTVLDDDLLAELKTMIDDPNVDAQLYLKEKMLDPDYKSSIPYVMAALANQKQLIEDAGLRYIAYEGGQHVHHKFGHGIAEFLADFVNSEHMADLYEELWHGWEEIGDGSFMQFGDVVAPSEHGSFSLVNALDHTTPRAERLAELNENTEAWWEDRGGEHFQHGVTERGDDTDDVMFGTNQEDYLLGSGGDDTLVGGAGNDSLHGGEGNDLVVLSGRPEDYFIYSEGDGYRLIGPDGSDFVIAVERFQFEDGTLLTLDEMIKPADAANAIPDAVDDNIIVNEDQETVITNLTLNDSDLDGDSVRIINVSSAQNGYVALNQNGTVSYLANPNYNGSDSFTYTITDGRTTSTASVNLTVAAVADAPDVKLGDFDVDSHAAQDTIVGTIQASDVDGDVLNYTIISGDPDGIFEISQNGEIRVGDADKLKDNHTHDYNLEIEVSDGLLVSTTDARIVAFGDDIRTMSALNGEFIDFGKGFDEYIMDAQNDGGLRVSALNNRELIGKELDLPFDAAYNGYAVYQNGVSVDFNGQLVGANYYSLNQNRSEKDGDILSETALDTLMAFGNVVINVEKFTGTEFGDRFQTGATAETIDGAGGNDTIYSAQGNDIIFGGAGDDRLNGAQDDDTVHGGEGNDRIETGYGSDTLYGDEGADTFVLQAVDKGITTISDFDSAEGDMIDISAVLQEYDPADDLISDFVQLTQDADDTIISIDVDGGADNFVQAIVVVDNTDFDLQAMISDSQLLV